MLLKKASNSSVSSRATITREKTKSPEYCLDIAIEYFLKEKMRTKKETLEFSIAKCNLEKAIFLIEYAEDSFERKKTFEVSQRMIEECLQKAFDSFSAVKEYIKHYPNQKHLTMNNFFAKCTMQ